MKTWLPEKERKTFLEEIFGLATFIGGAANAENCRHSAPLDGAPEPPGSAHEETLAKLKGELEEAVRRCEAAAERHALSNYAVGMLWGVGVVALVSGIIFLILGLAGKPAFYGVAAPAGGLGATISVLQRMTSRRIRVDYQTPRHLLFAYGALRPVIGAVFGALVFALLLAGLVPAVAIPTNNGTLIAFYAVLAFLGGFSERFAQDMLAGVTNVFPDPGLSGD